MSWIQGAWTGFGGLSLLLRRSRRRWPVLTALDDRPPCCCCRSTKPDTQEDKAFDVLTRELVFEAKAKPGERTLTGGTAWRAWRAWVAWHGAGHRPAGAAACSRPAPLLCACPACAADAGPSRPPRLAAEELAELERQRLEVLEAQRRRRQEGDEGGSDEDEGEGEGRPAAAAADLPAGGYARRRAKRARREEDREEGRSLGGGASGDALEDDWATGSDYDSGACAA